MFQRLFHSVQFSHSVMSGSLPAHGLQHARLPCPSPTPGAYSNSCPPSWWCRLTISFSVKRSGTWQIFKKYMLGSNSLLWKDWCWSWNPNILATCYEELTHQKRPWCWEKLKVGGKGDDRGWDGWVASPTQWTWAWVSSGHWWWTGKPGMLQSMGSQRVGLDWVTELNSLLVLIFTMYLCR